MQFSKRVVSKKATGSIMRSRISQMSFDLGDLRSHRKPMQCVYGNWPKGHFHIDFEMRLMVCVEVIMSLCSRENDYQVG